MVGVEKTDVPQRENRFHLNSWRFESWDFYNPENGDGIDHG